MARYIVRRLLTMALTMIVVSILVFAIVEIAPGNVARNILGAYATLEQEQSMQNQLGLDRSILVRYVSWLVGSDWQARSKIGLPLKEIVISQGVVQNYRQWWAVEADGSLVQWDVLEGKLVKLVRQDTGSTIQVVDDQEWKVDEQGRKYFWGLDNANRAALWVQGEGGVEFTSNIPAGCRTPIHPLITSR